MMNLKSFLLVSLACSALFAQFRVEKISDNKVLLLDKEGKELELKRDETKWTIELVSDLGLDKLVLKKQYQIKITDGKQEVLMDVVQAAKENNNKIAYGGDKKVNKQNLHIHCKITSEPKDVTNLKYEKTSVACLKTAGCKSYTLGTDKKFKFGDSSLCTGKKEAEISTTDATIEEKITCALYDEGAEDSKTYALISYTNANAGKEKYTKITDNAECK
jgi:hypothetical protein